MDTSLNDTSKTNKLFLLAQFTKFENENDLYKGQYMVDPSSHKEIKHGLGSMHYANGSIYEG